MKKRIFFLGAIAALILSLSSCSLFEDYYTVTFKNDLVSVTSDYISEVKFYVNGELKETKTEKLTRGGSIEYDMVAKDSDVYFSYISVKETPFGDVEVPFSTKIKTVNSDITIKASQLL